MFLNYKLFKSEKIKFIIISILFSLLFIINGILLPFTKSIDMKYKILGEVFIGILLIISLSVLIIVSIFNPIINIEFNDDKIIIKYKNKKKEILYKDIKEASLAHHLIYGSFVKTDNDLSPIYYINDGNNKLYFGILHKDFNKIKNNDLKNKLSELYNNKATRKTFNKDAKRNIKYFIKY